jgi:hypothetical protein
MFQQKTVQNPRAKVKGTCTKKQGHKEKGNVLTEICNELANRIYQKTLDSHIHANPSCGSKYIVQLAQINDSTFHSHLNIKYTSQATTTFPSFLFLASSFSASVGRLGNSSGCGVGKGGLASLGPCAASVAWIQNSACVAITICSVIVTVGPETTTVMICVSGAGAGAGAGATAGLGLNIPIAPIPGWPGWLLESTGVFSERRKMFIEGSHDFCSFGELVSSCWLEKDIFLVSMGQFPSAMLAVY